METEGLLPHSQGSAT